MSGVDWIRFTGRVVISIAGVAAALFLWFFIMTALTKISSVSFDRLPYVLLVSALSYIAVDLFAQIWKWSGKND